MAADSNTQALKGPTPLFASEEPLRHVAYIYDGSLEGLLCAIFESYVNHEMPEDFIARGNNNSASPLQQRFGQSTRTIETNFDKALRVRNGIVREGGNDSFEAVARASCATNSDTGSVVFRFVHYLMDKQSRRNRRQNPLNDLANPVISDLMRVRRRVINEEEHMRQFIRFNQLENGLWYARCHPNCNVIPLITGHFFARFSGEPFIIFDETHLLCGVSDGSDWKLVADAPNIPCGASKSDMLFEEAWKRFYQALAIDARYHPELRRQFMPARFWKDLPEMKPLSKGTVVRSANGH